jgi:hypothetical protein
MNLTTTSLSHLGIVAEIFDELGIAELINTCMPKNRSPEWTDQISQAHISYPFFSLTLFLGSSSSIGPKLLIDVLILIHPAP